MVIFCMLEVAWRLSTLSFAFNPELQDDLFLFSCVGQEKSFFALGFRPFILAIVEIYVCLELLTDNQTARIGTLWVVDVDCQVSHLAGQVKVLRHCHLHVGFSISCQTHTLDKGYTYVKLGIVHNWAHRGNVNAFSRPDLTLSPAIVKKLMTDRH